MDHHGTLHPLYHQRRCAMDPVFDNKRYRSKILLCITNHSGMDFAYIPSIVHTMHRTIFIRDGKNSK